MKKLLIFISFISFNSLFAQEIKGGQMLYGIDYSEFENSITYDTHTYLYVECGDAQYFRFNTTAQQKIAVYEGSDRDNLQLIEEFVAGGSVVSIFNNGPIYTTNFTCKELPESRSCIELLILRLRIKLPISEEKYYFFYEGFARDSNIQNIALLAPQKFTIGLNTVPEAEQLHIESFESGIIHTHDISFHSDWINAQNCINDTITYDASVFTRDYQRYEYSLYTPTTNWLEETKVNYKNGFSEESPLGDNYFVLSPDGKLQVSVKEEGNYLVGICATAYDLETNLVVAENCQEFTLQFYDCEPKVKAAIADAEQNADDTYIIGSCETEVSLAGNNLGSLSSGAFSWSFQDENGENYAALQRNPVFEFPNFGTYTGQLNVEAEGCRDSVQVEINIGAPPVSGLEEIYEVCDLPLILEGNQNVNFLWDDGSTSAQREILQSGTYQLTVSDKCERTQNILVRNLSENTPSYELIATEDTTICLQNSYTLSLERDDLSNITWNGTSIASLEVRESGIYSVFATTEQGCELYDEIRIAVIDCEGKVYIPNTFSPNGDGVNDRFEISLAQAEIQSLRVFDRWGNMIYETRENTAWDGFVGEEAAPTGLYVYQLEYYEPLLDRMRQMVGEVVLVR